MQPDPSAESVSALIRDNRRLREELDAARAALAELREQFELLAQASQDHDPRPVLRGVQELRRRLDQLESQQVRAALARGFSYAEIAAELGVTRQSVHQKHGPRPRADER